MRYILMVVPALWAGLFGVANASFSLRAPIDCDFRTDCYIQQYVDHDPSRGASDFRCGSLSYHGHKGTDFALRSLDDMRRGVNVLAAAPGRVIGWRDGMADRYFRRGSGDQLVGRECGNGVAIDHGDGWVTQYCHLKKGSVRVRKGQQVRAGTVLGQVGLSGRTQFPHLHLSVERHGRIVDPFAPNGAQACKAPRQTLWQTAIPYRQSGLIEAGFSPTLPQYGKIKEGRAKVSRLDRSSPALVLYGFAFGGQPGDRMRIHIDGPLGTVIREDVRISEQQAKYFRAAGKKRPAGGWVPGRYIGQVSLIRRGQVIDTQNVRVDVR